VLDIFLRTLIMYGVVSLSVRIMGKRQIGELEPSELVVTIMISEVASLPIDGKNQNIIPAVIAILTLVVIEVFVSYLAYKSRRMRQFLYGTPSVFYEKGKINKKEMDKQRFNLNDLMETVRNAGASSLDEVDFVIMETNGNMSVIMNELSRPLSPEDLGLKPEPPEISYVIIDNGKINFGNLKKIGFNREWLDKAIMEEGHKSPDEILLMTADKSGKIFLQKCK